MATKYTEQKDGRFITRIWDGTYNEDGTKHRVAIYSRKSSKDLEKKVNAFKEQVAKREITVTTDMLFLDYARQWKNVYKAPKEDKTKEMYNNIVEKHFKALEGVKLINIRNVHLQTLINNAIEKPRTCQQIMLTFKQVIKSAITDRHLPPVALDDIFASVEVPKYTPSAKRALTEKESQAWRKADYTNMERAFMYIIYGCGLRRGEVLALTQFDVNLKKKVIKINKAHSFAQNTPKEKGPKSHNGYREVPMPDFVSDYLKQYIGTLNQSGKTDPSYLIHKQNGDRMTKSSYDKMWRQIKMKINRAAGGTDKLCVVDGLTAHVFRHNFCTNLCYQIPEISIDKIAVLMGDTKKMVLEVYSHILSEKEDAQAVVNKALNF